MAENHGVSTSTTMPSPVQHRGSPMTRPKIKIIHIIAPEIIKTDVANFRDLVQRLTGKPTSTNAGDSSMMSMSSQPPVEDDNKEMVIKKRPPPAAAPVTSDDFLAQQEPCSKKRKVKCEVKIEEGGGFFGDYAALDCNDLWMDFNPGAGSFLSFLEEELEVFQGLQAADHDLLQMPLGPARVDLVGEMYAS